LLRNQPSLASLVLQQIVIIDGVAYCLSLSCQFRPYFF
jgi:hypothetical protein